MFSPEALSPVKLPSSFTEIVTDKLAFLRVSSMAGEEMTGFATHPDCFQSLRAARRRLRQPRSSGPPQPLEILQPLIAPRSGVLEDGFAFGQHERVGTPFRLPCSIRT
ncbi:MAG: hypothetical protein ABI779_17390 [Acidobacteriota bacterium]